MNLDRLIAHVERHAGEPLPPDLIVDLRRLLACVKRGGPTTALLANSARAARNRALCRCGELLSPDGGTWRRALLLSQLVTRAQRAPWTPRTEAEHVLAHALECGPCPITPRQLYSILSN